MDPKRDDKGRFGAGNNANPGGRPKALENLRQRALDIVTSKVVDAWEAELELKTRIVGHTKDGEPIHDEQRGKDWVKCSELLAAYGAGKPVQQVEHVGDESRPVRLVLVGKEPQGDGGA